MHLDHIILAIADLDDGIRQIHQRLGVSPAVGGHHPKGVTRNALLSLGEQPYLELIALRDDIPTPEERRWMLETKTVRPIGWAVSTDDVTSAKAQLEQSGFSTTDVVPGERQLPGGGSLSWATFSLRDRIAGAPFFIQWGAGVPHPASTSPSGCVLKGFLVASPDHARLGDLVSAAGLKIRVQPSSDPEPRFQAEIESPKGLVVIE